MTKADVQGRLNRETNPIPGERPGFNPQFIDSDGYATDVTPNTPFPSGSYVQTDAGVWVPQKGNNDGAAHVQLTGSYVEDNRIKTSLDNSSHSENYLENVSITAGSVAVTDNIVTQGTRIGVGVRFANETSFRVDYMSRSANGGTLAIDGGKEILVNENSRYDSGSAMLNSKNIVVRVFNTGAEDTTINVLTITEFMASGSDI